MQGRQNVSNLERKGPHKSMHCKFCKPPGVVTPEKSNQPQLETKTKIHLAHEGADLRLCNVHDEPGVPAVESEACVCILEGENPCPKCAFDKNRPPPKKKVCRCPKGAKPHPSMYNEDAPKKKKPKDEDDEFWWEKYSREHDATAKETWAAYLAQRRKEKKLAKCQKREQEMMIAGKSKGTPAWYQKLSCQQMIYVEFLSTAIRLDSDENITDRTYFVLGGIGLYPRPNRILLKKCLRYCHYNSIRFLNQLHMLTKDDDPFKEKEVVGGQKQKVSFIYTWNEKLIMNSMCYLEFPTFLREIMDRLPPLPQEKILPQIPYPVFARLPKKKYECPYEEPIWQDRLDWVEKMKIDRLNRCRAHMETKRVKIPSLALVRRPSLIDARPPFLAQIEANERASRMHVKGKKKKPQKRPIPTFDSAVDVTAIAGIEASEISTTDKADTEDICVFLREPKEPESGGGETEEEPDFLSVKEVKFLEEPPKSEETQVNRIKLFSDFEENSVEEEEEVEEIPFKTPPKTNSGATIASPCPPPQATPGPPAPHFDRAKRELDIINEELCGFFPFVSSSTQTVREDVSNLEEDVELKLKTAAAKLKNFALENDAGDNLSPQKKKNKKFKKKEKCKKRKNKKSSKMSKSSNKLVKNKGVNMKEEEEDFDQEEEKKEEIEVSIEGDEENEDIMKISYKLQKEENERKSTRASEISDPDPDTDDEWSARPPCSMAVADSEADKPAAKRKSKKKGRSLKKKPRRKKESKTRKNELELKEKAGEDMKKKEPQRKQEKETMPESDANADKGEKAEKEEEGEKKKEEMDVFTGEVGPLVEEIIKDLAEEGFHCASYPFLYKHPDIEQLISYLKGEIVTKELRETLRSITKLRWSQMKGPKKMMMPELGISPDRAIKADWNDKKWISRLAKSKIDQFYYKVASSRAESGKNIYETLYQGYLGTDRYLKIFYAYMISKYEDAILRGIF